jgi:hypothetical protein
VSTIPDEEVDLSEEFPELNVAPEEHLTFDASWAQINAGARTTSEARTLHQLDSIANAKDLFMDELKEHLLGVTLHDVRRRW